MNLKGLNLIERIAVRLAQGIYYTLIFALFATFFFLLMDGMINYLTMGKYDINTL